MLRLSSIGLLSRSQCLRIFAKGGKEEPSTQETGRLAAKMTMMRRTSGWFTTSLSLHEPAVIIGEVNWTCGSMTEWVI